MTPSGLCTRTIMYNTWTYTHTDTKAHTDTQKHTLSKQIHFILFFEKNKIKRMYFKSTVFLWSSLAVTLECRKG